MRPELETVCGDILRKELCQDHSTVAGCSGADVSSHCKTKPRDRCDSAWTSLSPAQVLAGKGQYLGRQCHTWGHRSHEQGGTKTAPRVVPCPSHRECPVQHEWPRPPAHHGLDMQDMAATRTHQSFHPGLRAAGASSRCGCGRVQCKEACRTLLLSDSAGLCHPLPPSLWAAAVSGLPWQAVAQETAERGAQLPPIGVTVPWCGVATLHLHVAWRLTP